MTATAHPLDFSSFPSSSSLPRMINCPTTTAVAAKASVLPPAFCLQFKASTAAAAVEDTF